MSHTPGPWSIEDRTVLNGCDILALVKYWGDEPIRIAHVVTFANYMDTARLMAAAPEMLAELKVRFEVTVCVCKLNPLVGKPIPCDKCRLGALIAKAEGREP